MVVLKIVVQADGTVGKVEVVRGEEPFLSAAIAAVKAWTYEPAKYQGKPIAVYRIIQMPFRLA
jgi:periplasmic protein TonB